MFPPLARGKEHKRGRQMQKLHVMRWFARAVTAGCKFTAEIFDPFQKACSLGFHRSLCITCDEFAFHAVQS
jgi:hypothetical protein